MSDVNKHTTYDSVAYVIVKIIYEMATACNLRKPFKGKVPPIFQSLNRLPSTTGRFDPISYSDLHWFSEAIAVPTYQIALRVEHAIRVLKAGGWEVLADDNDNTPPSSHEDALLSWFAFFQTSELKAHMLATISLYLYDEDFLFPKSPAVRVIEDVLSVVTEKKAYSLTLTRWQQKFESKYGAQKARLESATTHLKK